jgi:hypothetical protein
MNYEKIYAHLILNAIKRDEDHPEWSEKLYTENHHWFPKSLYPDYAKEKWNIVKLTAREHFVAHLLLHKMLPNCPKMAHAVWFMANLKSGKALSSALYASVREAHAIAIGDAHRGIPKPSDNYAKSWTPSRKAENAERMRLRNLGSSRSETTRQKISEKNLDRAFKPVNVFKGDAVIMNNVAVSTAARALGLDPSSLTKTARGVRKSAKGYRAVYV